MAILGSPDRGKRPVPDPFADLRIAQLYLDAANRRVSLLNEAARQLHAEGFPFTPTDPSFPQLATLSREPIKPAEFPLLVALREGRSAGLDVIWQRAERPLLHARWEATPTMGTDNQVTGVFATVVCGPPARDWQELAGLAHDLRTPLHALGLLLALLERQPANPTQQAELLQRLRASADRASEIGRELVEWCRAAGQPSRPTQASWFPLNPFLLELVREQEPAARQKGLVLTADLHATEGLEVLADRARLGRLLANLLVNAVRYTPKGHVALTAGWRDEPPKRMLAVGVVDTGAGISPEEQESIFEPFERGRAGRSDDSGGSGLGLAVVDRLTEELGLQLDVYSEYGRGSAFHLLLPEQRLRQALPPGNGIVHPPSATQS